MVIQGRRLLSGRVEVDETLIGGKKQGGKRGRGTEKAIVVIAIEIHEPMGFGRVRMQRIPDAIADSLVPFVCNSVEPGSNILTDSWRGYDTIEKFGYSEPIRGPLVKNIWTIISMNILFVLIEDPPQQEDCFSTVF
jgi:transposase-like protein